MNTLIVGAGNMGLAAGHYLKNNSVDVIFADKNWKALDEAIALGFAVIPIDKNTDWSLELEGVDVLLSAADYSINAMLTEHAIHTGTHMCDLGGNDEVVYKQRLFDSLAEERKVTIIPDCGLAPGMAGWLAAHAVKEMRKEVDTIDSVDIRVGGLPANPQPPLNYSVYWSTKGLINEYIEETKIIYDGIIRRVPSLSVVEDIKMDLLSEEYGSLEAFYTSGGISTLPESLLGLVNNLTYKTIRFKGHCDIMKSLQMIGLFSSESDHGIVPRDFTEYLMQKNLTDYTLNDMVLLKVLVKSSTKTRKFEAVEFSDAKLGHSAMARMTAYSAAIVAQMLGKGEIEMKGVCPGEKCIPMDSFLTKLRGAGINITDVTK